MAIPVRIRRNADGTISDITLCPKQEDIYAELTKVKKQLAIAVEALEEYGNCENWFNTYDSESADFEPLYWANKWKNEFGYKYAQEKLKQIEELNK